MANICCNRHAIEGCKQDINRFYYIMRNLKDAANKSNRPLYLGTVAESFGISMDEVPCKGIVGYIHEPEETGNHVWNVRFDTETPWEPMPELFDLINRYQFGGKLNHFYSGEEPNCEVYCSNDTEGRYFPERYILQYNDGEYQIAEYFPDLKKVSTRLHNRFGINKAFYSFDEAQNVLNAYNTDSDDAVYLYEIEIEGPITV